jgi:hypothetical protein
LKKILLALLMLALSIGARAQFVPFVPNQILTAQALNGAFAQFIPITGTNLPVTFTGLTVTGSTALNSLTVNGAAVFNGSATFNGPTSITGPVITGATITGSTINSTPIGATTPSSGAFTTLTSTGTTSFTGAASATTQSTNDNSTLIATDAFTNQQIIRSTTTVPLTLAGGTYNQATLGSGFSPVVFASGGVIGSILTIASAGSGYAVGDLVTLAGGNVDATLRVASVSGGGVTSATVLYGGTGYSNGAQVMASMIPPGDRNVILTGALTSNVTFIIANGTYDTASRRPSFANNTTGAFTVTVFLSNGADGTTGSGYLLPQGSSNNTSVLLQTDGETNVWPIDTPAGIGALSSAAGSVPLTSLATQAANTVVGNATGSTASPTAITVTGCNGAAQALQWTNGSGFGCNSGIATSGANANITSLSGLSTALSVAQGGTGRATLTTHGVLVGEGTSAINQLAAGATGQMLLGVTGADPAFGNNATITSGTITSTPISGSTGSFTTVSASSTITPSSTAGIVGTTTNDSANAGSVGEFPAPSNLSGVSLTSGSAANVSSTSLTAGDWDVECVIAYTPSSTSTVIAAGINTTSAALPATGGYVLFQASFASAALQVLSSPIVRESLSSTTTTFCIAQATFAGTMTASGFMRARRVR